MKTKTRISIKITSVLISIGLVLVFKSSFAQSPREVNISAYIVNGENKEITNGDYDVRFSLYAKDRSVANPYPSTADASVWTETQKIKISDGFLNAYLGATTPIPNGINFTSGAYYLGIRIGTDSEMIPRKRIGSVPLAVDSFSVQGAVPGTAAGNLSILGTGGKINIKQLPTGTSGTTLVLGNDSRLTQTSLTISGGYNYLSVSNHRITLNQIDLGTDITGTLDISNGGTNATTIGNGGSVAYSDGTSYAFTGVGTAGQVLLSNGSGAPVWSDLAGGMIPNDSLDFAQFKDAMTVDNNTTIDSSANTLEITGATFGNNSLTLADNYWLGLGGADGRIEFNNEATDTINILGANVGIGDATPASLFTVGNGDLFQVNSSGEIIAGTWKGGVIDEAYGGTGNNTYNEGDMLYYSGGALTRLAAGNNGQILGAIGGASVYPTWMDAPFVGSHNLLSLSHPDTTAASPLGGDLITGVDLGGGIRRWQRYAIGAANQLLMVNGSGNGVVWNPQTSITQVGTLTSGNWNANVIADAYVADALTITGGTITSSNISTSNITLVQSANPTPTAEGRIEWDSDNDQIVVGNGVGQTIFSPNAVTMSGGYDYITLIGQDIVRGQIDLAADVNGTLPIENGGTERVTLTANAVLYGNGTAPVGLAAGTAGQVLLINGSNIPTFTALSGDISISDTGIATIQSDSVTLATDTIGNYVQSITNGNGISGGNGGSEGAALTLALSNLTSDWNQNGAFDLVLGNASSELKIMESSGDTFYGIFDVTDLSGNRTYTFPDQSGTVAMTSDLHSAVTLTNSPATYDYLTISGQAITLNQIDLTPTTGDITGTLGVANGGIGRTTLTSNAVLTGNTTGAVNMVAPSGTGQFLLTNGSSIPAFASLSGDVSVDATGLATIQSNSVALATDTTGNYVQSIASGNGITGGAAGSEGAALTLAVNILDSAVGTGTTASYSGMEFIGASNQLSFLQGCANNEVLSWDDSNNVWKCASVSGVGGVTGTGTNGYVAYWTGTSTLSAEQYLSVSRGGTGAGSLNDLITLGTHTTGNYVSTITAGNGISGASSSEGGTPTIALSNLTGDWTQSGAYDIVLANASSELKIMESAGGTYYGIFDVADLSASDKTYTFPNASGTVVLGSSTANYMAYWNSANSLSGITGNDGILVTNGSGVPSIGTDIPTAVTIGGSYIYRVGGTDVSASDGGTGRSTLTTNGVLYGNGTSAVGMTAQGNSGDILVANGSNIPAFVAMSGDVHIDATGLMAIQASAVGSSEIIDNSIAEADLLINNAPTDTYILSYDQPTGGFEWILNDGGSGTSKWTDAGSYTYLTNTGDNLVIGGSAMDQGFVFNVAASTLTFEGAAPDSFETTIGVIDPTGSDKTINFPNATGTVALGTGTSGYAAYWSGTNTIGSEQYLSVSRGGTGLGTFGGTNTLLYTTSADALNSIATANNSVLLTNGSGVPNWSAVSNDSFAQYALLTGRNGGQTLIGGTVANNALIFQGNSAGTGNTATNASIYFKVGDSGATTAMTILNNGYIGIGDSSPSALFTVGNGDLFTINSSSQVQIGNNGQSGMLTLYSEQGGTDHFVKFQPSGSMSQDVTYTLPTDDGDASQVLITNGSGTLSWSSVSGVGALDGTGSTNAVAYWVDNNTLTYENQLALSRGGTGANLSDPNADRIMFWDDSEGSVAWLTTAPNISISGTAVNLAASITLGSNGTSGDLTLYSEQGGTDHFVKFQPSGSMSQDVTYTLPTDDGDASQVLITNGSGTLSWSSVSGVGALDGTGSTNAVAYWVDNNTLTYENQLALSRGGTGANLSDPNADRIMFWDDSEGSVAWLTTAPNISISGTAVNLAASITLGSNGTSGDLTLYSEQGGTDHFVKFQPSGSMSQDVTYTLPTDDGGIDQVLKTDGSGNLTWTNVSGIGGVTGTGTNGYAAYWTGTSTLGSEQYLSVSRGGIGAGTLALNGVLYGNGTSAVQATSAGTSGQILVANNSQVPTFVSMSGDIAINYLGQTTIQSDSVTLATDTIGNYVQSITNGNGISGGNGGSEGAALTLALSNLTSDWNQNGAFDLVLGNASSELKIMESSGDTFYGIFDVTDLSGNRTYTFPDQSGTVAMTSDLHSAVTLTNSPATYDYLTISGQAITLNQIDLTPTTGDITGTLGVANGGIGRTTLTSNAVLTGNTTGAVNMVAPSGTGQFLLTNGSSIPAFASLSGDVSVDATGLATIQSNSVALATDTTGNYVQSIASGNGITGGAAGSEGAALTLAVNILDSAVGTGTTASYSGMEFIGASNQLSFLQGCANNEVLSWDDSNNVWKCASVSGVGGVTGTGTNGYVAYWTGTSTLSAEQYLSVSRGGTGAGSLNDLITLGTHTTGNYVSTITAGNGISGASSSEGGTPTIALSNLTGDWTQSGAYDIVLANASSELKIMESAGGTYYGIFDVADLSASDKTYTFPNASGTVVLGSSTANYMAYWNSANSLSGITGNDGILVTNGSGVPSIGTDIPTAVTIGGSYIYRVGGTDVSASDGGTGRSTLTTNGVLYGNGTSAVGMTAQGNSGDILVANGSNIPAFVAMSGDVHIDATGLMAIQASAVGSSEIIDNSIAEADLLESAGPTNGYILSYNLGTGGFTWVANNGGSGSSKWTDAGSFTYLTSTTNDLVVGGSTTDTGFFFDASASTLVFEGATPDNYETTIGVVDPTGDRAINFPNNSGTVALTSDLHSAATVSGGYDYVTLSGQDIVRGQIDLATDITGILSAANGGTGLDTHLLTGVPTISSGTWVVSSALPVILGGTGENNETNLENKIEAYIFDADAENVLGAWTVNDNVNLNFGTDGDIHAYYDAAVNNRLQFTDGSNLLMALSDAGTVGNLYVTGGVSTYDNTVTAGYGEFTGLCLGNGTNCITSWASAGAIGGSGTSGYAAYWSNANTLTAEPQLATSRGGTGLDTSVSAGIPIITAGTWSVATTSLQLAGVISDETGTGRLAFSTSPSFTTPSLGAATATSINGMYLTSILGSGQNNNAIGFQALYTNTTGFRNNAFGLDALWANVGGSGNIAIGSYTMSGEDGDSYGGNSEAYANNTVIGDSAGYVTGTNMSNNVFIGADSGYYQMGSNNTYLGTGSGYGSWTLNTSSNVFLGYQAGYYETGSNKLFIDNQQRASEADARIKSLLYGVFDAATANQSLALNGSFKILEGGSSAQYYTTFQGGDQSGNITYTLPTTTPVASGYALVSTTGGVLSWAAASGFANPMTTAGDIIFGTGSGVAARLAGAAGFLTSNGTTPQWTSAATDYFTQYALLAGRGAGQTLIGGTNPNGTLIFQGNSSGTGNTATNANMQFKVGNSGATTAMTILNSGYVGIGVTNPGQNLSVAGTLGISSTSAPYYTIFQGGGQVGDITYTLPVNDGDASQVLTSNGSGVLSWTTVTGGVTDHGALSGLLDDDHTQYALLAGRGAGQTLIGGTNPNGTLTFQGNSSGTGNTATNANMYFKVGDSGATTAMTILNDGNVGIGNTNPTYNFQIAGTIGIGGSAYFTSGMPTDGAATTAVFLNGSNQLVSRALGSLAFSSATYDNYASWTIQDGDTSTYPITTSAILQLASGTGITSNFTGDKVLTITNTDLGSSQYIFKNISVPSGTSPVADSNNDTLTFQAGANVSITGSGDDIITISSVDVGFSNPMTTAGDIIFGTGSGVAARLAGATGFLTSNGTTPQWTSASTDYFTEYALLAGRGAGQTLIGGTNPNGTLTFQGNSSGTGNTATNVNMYFKVGNSAATTAVAILNNGNVGIGTTNPFGIFSVGSASGFQIDTSGFIGLGGTTPLFTLGVDSADSNKFKIYSGNGIAGTSEFTIDSNGTTSIANLQLGAQAFDEDSGAISWIDMSVSATPADNTEESYTAYLDGNSMLTVYGQADHAGNADTLRVLFPNGNIGIGTTVPSQLFQVNNSGTSAFVVTSGGSVGIGITSPLQKLSVNGTLGIAGTTAPYYTIFQGGGQAANITYTLPTTTPVTSGYALVSTTGGVLSWASTGMSNPMTTAGDIIFGTGSGVAARLAGATGFLTSNGTTPQWTSASTDYFTEYALLAGRGAGQTLIGGTNPNGTLTFQGNSSGTGNTATNVNMYFKVGNSAATTAVAILNNGNVGIGTTAPGALLDIFGTSNALRLSYDASHYVQISNDGTNGIIATNAGGSLNLGTSGDLTLGSGVNIVGEGNYSVKGDSSSRTITIGDTSKANDDVVKIDASNWSVASTGTITDLQVYSDTVGVTTRDLYVDSTGKLGYVSSSERYKKNIANMEDISWLYNLRPVNYTYKSDGTNREQYGLIAEEVDKINPLFVSYNDQGQPETVSYSMFPSVLIKALQEQKTEIDGSQTAISGLEKTLADQNISTGDKINVIGTNLTDLNSEIQSQGSTLSDLRLNLSQLSQFNSTLQSQMDDIKAQNTAIIDFFAVLDPETMVLKDALGNVDLLKGQLEAEGVVAGAFTVKVVDDQKKTIGKEKIYKVDTDENGDGIDDTYGTDGKNVFVKTKAVSEGSRIFVTPKLAISEPLAVTEIKSGEGFTVSIKNSVSEDVEFDWFIVEEKNSNDSKTSTSKQTKDLAPETSAVQTATPTVPTITTDTTSATTPETVPTASTETTTAPEITAGTTDSTVQ